MTGYEASSLRLPTETRRSTSEAHPLNHEREDVALLSLLARPEPNCNGTRYPLFRYSEYYRTN